MSNDRSKWFSVGANGKVLKESNKENKVKSSPIYGTQTITDIDGVLASKEKRT